LRPSREIQEELRQAESDLEAKKNQLLEKKNVFLEKLEHIFPLFVDKAVQRVISYSDNSERIRQLSDVEIRKLKKELNEEKPRAIEAMFNAVRSSSDWLRYSSIDTSSSQNPIVLYGVNYDGPVWKLIKNYSTSLSAIFVKHGLKVQHPTGQLGYFENLLEPQTGFFEQRGLSQFNNDVGKAHFEYCKMLLKVESLNSELKRAKVLERFESL
jgi:hypothetical protein